MRILLFLLIAFQSQASLAQKIGHSHGSVSLKATTHKAFPETTQSLPDLKPTETVVLNDGDTFTLTAMPVKQKINGKWIRRLSYNGMIPGPMIRVKQGSKAKIVLENHLDLETTLHSHGLRIPYQFDGVPGLGQEPIKPSGKFTYELNFDDAGLFWYHPHIRDDYTQGSGLYGLYVVDPKDPDLLPKVDHEVFLVLDDIGSSQASRRYFVDKTTHTLMGRFRELPLINGRLPKENRPFQIDQGETARFYILNAASTRPFRFAMANTKMSLIGSDGGYFQNRDLVSDITIGPSERYTVDAVFSKAGTIQILNNKPHQPWNLGNISVKKAVKAQTQSTENTGKLDGMQNDIKDAFALARNVPDFTLNLTMDMDHEALSMSHSESPVHKESKDKEVFYYRGRTSGIEWDDEMPAMNAKSDDKNVTWKIVDTSDKKENMNINWKLKKNQFYRIRIKNDPYSINTNQQTIHIHGQHFLVASVNGVNNPNPVWKDTVLVGSGDTVDIILNTAKSGRWMAHCHILEHISAQMMMGFEVED